MAAIEHALWGRTADGVEVSTWTLRAGDQQITLTDLGGRWLSWQHHSRELLVGPDSVAEAEVSGYFGAIIGRYANRIRGGRFSVDGVEYQIPPNEGENSLHGGPGGFSELVWRGEPAEVDGSPALELRLTSPAGQMGFPGTLEVSVRYVLGDAGVRIEYWARSDARTVLNLTNHAFFNLDGEGDIRGHQAQIPADSVVAVDAELLPTGQLWAVTGTDFDLRSPRELGPACASDDPRIQASRGIDHCYVLRPDAQFAARLTSSDGLTMEVTSDQPAVQLYCGQYLTGRWRPYQALCLETQHFPDGPNQPSFPATLLDADTDWRSSTSYRIV